MAEIPAALAAFLAAARARDKEAVDALIDWPLSGAARMVRALADVSEKRREAAAGRGLGRLRPGTPRTRTGRLLLTLQGEVGVRPADGAERERALATIAPPPAPPGLSAAIAAEIEAIRRRATRVTDVYVLDIEDRGPMSVALSPEGDSIILTD